MKHFGIIGAGLMGSDIAHLAAENGYEAMLFDIDAARLAQAHANIRDRLERYVSFNRIDRERCEEIMSRVHTVGDIEEYEKADFMLECVNEDLALKQSVFKKLDRICRGGVVLATNTSSISITAIGSATRRPDSVIGMHFLNPVRAMKLVEIVCGLATTRETFETAREVVRVFKKVAVESGDFPGFLLNRMLMPMINEAIYALYEGAGTVDSIDKVMKQGINIPMGPLELADLVGLDIVLAVMEQMHQGFGDSKYRPCPLLRNYVAAGYLGRKSGKGFYHYND